MLAGSSPIVAGMKDIIPAHGWWLRDGAVTYESAYVTVMHQMLVHYGDQQLGGQHHASLVLYTDHMMAMYNKTGLANFPSRYIHLSTHSWSRRCRLFAMLFHSIPCLTLLNRVCTRNEWANIHLC